MNNNLSGYRQYELDNGLIVALQNIPSQTIIAKLRVNYSTFHEQNGEEGMAHFLEHCLIGGGSRKYSPSEADLLRDSSYSNAFTSVDKIQFVADMLPEDIETWLDLTADHIFNPRFDLARVEGERKRVIREIADAKSSSSYGYERLFNQLFFGNHPRAKEVLGSENVIKNSSINDLWNFYSRGFYSNNMDLILVGNLPSSIDDLIKKYFGVLRHGENTRPIFPSLKPLDTRRVIHAPMPSAINFANPQDSSANLNVNFRGPIKENPQSTSIIVLNQLLGGDTSSRLYQSLGLNDGLAYSFATYYAGDYNLGHMAVTAKVPAKKINPALDTIFKEMHKLRTQLVDEKDIDRIKRKTKFHFAKLSCSDEGFLHSIETLLDSGLTLNDWMQRYDNVSSRSILEVANRYLPDKDNGNYIICVGDPLKK